MAGFSESSTVQAWLVERLVGLGWEHVPGKDLPRSNVDVVVEEWLIEAVGVLNPLVRTSPERVDEVLPTVRSTVLSAMTVRTRSPTSAVSPPVMMQGMPSAVSAAPAP